jgi:hypothetical protein
LLDEWDVPPYGGYFKQEYDETGRLTKSRLYSGSTLIYTIVFFYERKNVVKEIWYNGDTKEKGDEVFYTHDPKGLILTTRSFILDYHVINKFTSTGNLSEWTLYSGGQPVVTGQYTYLNHYKNSDRAIPGLEYGFPFANGAYNQNKWYSTSEDIILYDEKGNPFPDADQDPNKTIAEVGHQNYVTASDFYDVLNQQWIHFRFTYDNCGSTNDLTEASSSKLSPLNIDRRKSILQKLLVHRSAKYIKEQIKELRKEMKK